MASHTVVQKNITHDRLPAADHFVDLTRRTRKRNFQLLRSLNCPADVLSRGLLAFPTTVASIKESSSACAALFAHFFPPRNYVVPRCRQRKSPMPSIGSSPSATTTATSARC